MFTQEFIKEVQKWRRFFHKNPEIAFKEYNTSDFIAQKLESFGLTVHRGLAGTGVVGTLTSGSGTKKIGLRADMDALPMTEENTFSYCSTNHNMHACGHDGHMAMLLGAAKYLSVQKPFEGTVYFIFQPGEENEAGGKVMIDEGLFTLFPCDEVYGLHNWPGLKAGTFAVRKGPIMASNDIFDIILSTDKSGHAALPHLCKDTLSAAAGLVQDINQITGREISAQEPVVISVTQISGGTTYNILPESTRVSGTVRAFSEACQKQVQKRLELAARAMALKWDLQYQFHYEKKYCATINTPASTEVSCQVIQAITKQPPLEPQPSMASEDFGFMLKEKPGCYTWMGNGRGQPLHNALYDFNDSTLEVGIHYWITLVKYFFAKA